MKGFIVQRDYLEINEKPFIFLYGRLENYESFICSIEYQPYFYIKEKDRELVKQINSYEEIEIARESFSSFGREKVIKLTFKNQTHLSEVFSEFRKKEVETFEADIKPEIRFLIENNLFNIIKIEGEFKQEGDISRFYENPTIAPSEGNIDLKILSIDIEANSQEIYCIGLYSNEIREVLFNSKEKIKNIESYGGERECLAKFRERVKEIDPDIITGWNFIDFDLAFLKKKFEEHNIPFDIGRDNRPIKLRLEKNFLKKSRAFISGRIALDALSLIKDPFIKEAPSIKKLKFDSYALEDISKKILGKTKLIVGKDRHKEIDKLFNGSVKDKERLAKYNLMDCQLVYEIIEKTKIVDLAVERANLTGMTLDRITSSISSFDSLYIRKARRLNLVSPTNIFKDKPRKITGGFVTQPMPGIYENVLVLDFKSLYPSIIRTFNIDPASFLEKKEKNCIESPNGACFKNQDGILPEIIQTLYEAREKAKKEKRELSSYAIKIIMNSFFGILASPNSRYFNMKIGNAITTFGQELIKLTAKEIEKMDFEVIYGDTDSIFIKTGKTEIKAKELAKIIPDKINQFYIGYIEKKYKRKSFLTLEFDKLYLKLLIPRVRIGKNENEVGAKKRYAGIVNLDGVEALDLVGLEAVRGDWTEAAKEFQKELLMKIFQNEDSVEFIRGFVKQMKEQKMDEKLVYRKSLRKNLEEYTKTTPPHVKAARKLKKIESSKIEYYITLEGPEPLEELKNKIDYEHYIEKQIKPIAKTILETIGEDSERAFLDYKQKTLF